MSTLSGRSSTEPWLASKTLLTHPTRNRYRWIVDNNTAPRIGHIRLGRLRTIDLNVCYEDLLHSGGRCRQGSTPKTVLEVHRVVSNALGLAVDRQLIDTNPALRARPPRQTGRSTIPQIWSASELAEYLDFIDHRRLYPALHLVAHIGMRRGELAGLNWATSTRQLQACRSLEPVRPPAAAPSKPRSRHARVVGASGVRHPLHNRSRVGHCAYLPLRRRLGRGKHRV